MIDNEEQVDIICDGVVQVYSKTELLDNLNNKAVLTVKAGFDPTAPDLHPTQEIERITNFRPQSGFPRGGFHCKNWGSFRKN